MGGKSELKIHFKMRSQAWASSVKVSSQVQGWHPSPPAGGRVPLTAGFEKQFHRRTPPRTPNSLPWAGGYLCEPGSA